MEEELRLSLLLLGGFFILGVLAHGLWNIRKNSQASRSRHRVEPEDWQHDTADEQDNAEDAHGYDEYGVGEVRVVNKPRSESTEPHIDLENSDFEKSDLENSDFDDNKEPDTEHHDIYTDTDKPTQSQAQNTAKAENVEQAEAASSATEDSATDAEPEPTQNAKIYASVVSNPKPQFAKGHAESVPDSVPAPPSFLLKEANSNEESGAENTAEQSGVTQNEPSVKADKRQPEDDFSLDVQPAPESMNARKEPAAIDLSEQQSKPKKPAAKKRGRQGNRRRQEPSFGDDEQMQIDFDESAKASPEPDKGSQVEPEVLILNVRAPEEAPISGAALLPMLLTLGFKFGEQDIFHRHVNSNGKGPVLFSLANMFKPGNFDIDNLETFTTRGISLFMLLPIEGDPHQVFNMMHNAARKIADEFDAQVLDGRRSVLTKQGLQQYVEKIRDFERKRMIAKQ